MEKLAVDIGTTFQSPFGQSRNLGDLVSLAIQLAFVVAGLLILFMFFFGGFLMITGAGNSNPQQAEKGRNAASAAALGFFVVFVAYWIVRLIELVIGVQFITGGFLN